jgi:hypothetical protein
LTRTRLYLRRARCEHVLALLEDIRGDLGIIAAQQNVVVRRIAKSPRHFSKRRGTQLDLSIARRRPMRGRGEIFATLRRLRVPGAALPLPARRYVRARSAYAVQLPQISSRYPPPTEGVGDEWCFENLEATERLYQLNAAGAGWIAIAALAYLIRRRATQSLRPRGGSHPIADRTDRPRARARARPLYGRSPHSNVL